MQSMNVISIQHDLGDEMRSRAAITARIMGKHLSHVSFPVIGLQLVT
jgi:hypothetical protein